MAFVTCPPPVRVILSALAEAKPMFLSNSSVMSLSPSATSSPCAGLELTSTGASTSGMVYCASVSLQAANPKAAAAMTQYETKFFIFIIIFFLNVYLLVREGW